MYTYKISIYFLLTILSVIIVFTSFAQQPPDTTPPTVESTYPFDYTSTVGNKIIIKFNESMNPTTVRRTDAYTVSNNNNNLQLGSVEYIDSPPMNNQYYLYKDHIAILELNLTNSSWPTGQINVRVNDTVTDIAGNRLDGDRDGQPGGNYSWSFNTITKPWPFRPVQNNHNIRAHLGAYRGNGYFHNGVDIVPTGGDNNVYLLESNIAQAHYPSSGNPDDEQVNSGDYVYIHITAKSVLHAHEMYIISGAMDVGPIKDFTGTPSGPSHVHLSKLVNNRWVNTLTELHNYTDTLVPEIGRTNNEFNIEIVRDNRGNAFTEDFIFGHIDIKFNTYNSSNHTQTHANDNNRLTPYSMFYQIIHNSKVVLNENENESNKIVFNNLLYNAATGFCDIWECVGQNPNANPYF